MTTYKQLTYELRSQIYALNKTGMRQHEMAQPLKAAVRLSRSLSPKL